MGFTICPHHAKLGIGHYKTICDCRKPAPGLLLKTSLRIGKLILKIRMIGDHNSDVEAGRAAGVKSIFVRTGHGEHEEEFVDLHVPRAANLYEAVKEYVLD